MLDKLLERFRSTADYRSAPNYSLGATFADARDEARRRGDAKIGTEHLLLALLRDPESARFVGCDLEAARAALDALDRDALAAVGLGGLPDAPPVSGRLAGRLPLTPAAKSTLLRAGRLAARARFQPRHLLLAVVDAQQPDRAAELLTALGIDPASVRARMSSAGGGAA